VFEMGSVIKSSVLCVAEKGVETTVLSLAWIPSSARFTALGTGPKGNGVLSVYSLNGRELVETGSANHTRPFRCGTFDVCDVSERVYCCGDMSGGVSLWDVETLTQVLAFRAHEDVLNAIAGGGAGSSEILTGGRDGEVKLWDRRSPQSAIVRMFPEGGESRRDCWTVAHAGADARVVAAGFDNGDIKVFDLRNMKLSWETSLSRGVSTLLLRPSAGRGLQLVAGTVNGKLLQWSVDAPDKPVSAQLDKSTVWDTQVMQDDTLVSCLGSGALCVSQAAKDKVECVLSHQVSEPPLNSLAASKDKPGLVATSSFDKNIRIFFYTGLK